MSEKLGSVLIAEVGSITTRVTLVDTVEGETRLIGRAEAATSAEPPYEDVLIGILEGAAQIADVTGRELLREGRLMKPQNSERDGINHVLVTTSAAGNLSLIVAGIARDVSARSALHAVRSTYTSILQTMTLDDAVLDPELQRTTSWVERQVQTMLALQPDAIVLAGGLEQGAQDVLCRLARVIGFTIEHMAARGQERSRDAVSFPVIYAGNTEARRCVQQALDGRADLRMVDNLRPTMDEERPEGVRRELVRLYDKQMLKHLPGIDSLEHLCSAPVSTVCHVSGLMTRFLSERYERRVLSLDIGSQSSSALLAAPGRYTPTILGTCGTGYGLMNVVQERGLHNIARWLPFLINDKDLLHWLLNKLVRPHIIPSSREDILLEQAIAREALTMVLATLTDELPSLQYDLVVAGGGVLAHAAHPGLAALTVLDALQPTADDSTLALDLHLDVLGLLPTCGALAQFDPDAAVTMFDRDVLSNQPLATCVVVLGEGKAGEKAVEAELTWGRGRTRRVSVAHGQIARLPLSPVARGQLTLRPASGVRIGRNPPGAEVSSDVAAIGGSALGVVIDARGRPLRLPRDEQKRRALLWEWLVALGVEEGQSPYLDTPVAEPPRVEVGEMGTMQMPAPLPSLSLEGSNGRAAPAPREAPQQAPPEPTAAASVQEPAPAAPEAPQRGKRISLSDVGQEPPPAVPPAPEAPPEAPQRGKRISLSDVGQEPPPAVPPAPEAPPEAPQRGKRISLSDVGQEPASTGESDAIQDDLAKLRGTVEPEPEKRGWFGRRKK